MNHLKWMGHAATVFEIQKNLRNDPQSCEVNLVAAGGSVRAHRFVLSSCSDLLHNLLADVPMDQEATIVVPDIRGSLLDSVLAFIYMGETNITSTNLSEFLEAINILGIKSAISFECNTAALSSASNSAVIPSSTANLPVKTISGFQIGNDELLEQDHVSGQKMEHDQNENSVVEQVTSNPRELEFLDVYNEPQHKITYSIEHMPGTSNANEFILTENAGTFTLTQNTKMDSVGTDSGKIEETEEDNDEAHIIEEYSSSTEPIIEIAENAAHANSAVAVASTSAPAPGVVQIRQKIKTVKLKMDTSASDDMHQVMENTIDATADPISVLNTSSESYSSAYNDTHGSGDSHLDMAVQAVIDEGISLQKAAQKFEVSKTVLWRRVRKNPNYMKTARENPLLTLAYERLKGGESLKNISRELDIPMSTLHRHKVRLAQQGRLPEYVTFKKRDSVSKDELREKLAKAVKACVHEGMSQNQAANLFAIPKSTLWRHLQKRVAEAELSQSMEAEEIIKEEVILS